MGTVSTPHNTKSSALAQQFSFRIEETPDKLRLSSFFNWTSMADLGLLFLFLFCVAALLIGVWYYEHSLGVWVFLLISGTLSLFSGYALIFQLIDFVEIDKNYIRWRCAHLPVKQLKLRPDLKLRIIFEDGQHHSRKSGTYYYRDLDIYLFDGQEEHCIISLSVDRKQKHQLDQFIKSISSKIKARILAGSDDR